MSECFCRVPETFAMKTPPQYADIITHLASQTGIFGTVANRTVPGRKYICSPVKSKFNILRFRWNVCFEIESLADEN